MGDILNLQQPLLDGGGIRSINFFNGRLLAGRDMQREQDARRESDWRLGQALGDGVAFGLDVHEDKEAEEPGAPSTPILKVRAGLAINRNGQVLRLEADTSVNLVRQFSTDAVAGKIFNACMAPASGVCLAGAGIYVLTIAPAETGEGKAPTNGLDPTNVRCNTDATVETVQFRLVPVKPISLYAGLDATAKDFRNRLAYLCFGSADRSAWLANPFGLDLARYGPVDALRKGGLTDCDVPLALIFMAGAGAIQFIDRWAVRRSPNCGPESPSFMPLTSARRATEGQAMFLQFQEQIAELRTAAGDLGGVTFSSHFPTLPPAGVIPVNRETDTTGAQATKFFAGLTYRGPAFVNAARVEMLIRQSLVYPPIDTTAGEAIWLYRVRENARASDTSISGGPQNYIVFASGHMPYIADAQFDLARWDYSNYALDR